MPKQEYKNLEQVRQAMRQFQDKFADDGEGGKKPQLAGMGPLAFLAGAIEKLADEVEQLKAEK